MSKSIRLRFWLIAGIASLSSMVLVGSKSFAKSDSNVLNIYNWSDYIGKNTIKNFTKETGIKVRYDTYTDASTPLAKLMAGNSGYDLVILDSMTAGLAVEGGLLQLLDSSKIPDLKNLNPKLNTLMQAMDPGNKYTAIWLWSYMGVGINEQAVKKALGGLPLPANPWALIFDPTYASKVSKCGLSLTDSAQDVIPEALIYIGKNPDSTNMSDYRDAGRMLKKIRPYVTRLETGGYIENLVSNNTCVAMGYSGDFNIAAIRTKEAKMPYTIKSIFPDTGAYLVMDAMTIPKDAKHVNNAEKFINYILQPKVAAELTNNVFFANAVVGSDQYVKQSIKDNGTVVLPEYRMKKLLPLMKPNPTLKRLETRAFSAFTSGVE